MTLKNRLQKLTVKLKPQELKIYYMGWADCEYRYSEGLTRGDDETKEAFCDRVYQASKKQFLWFD